MLAATQLSYLCGHSAMTLICCLIVSAIRARCLPQSATLLARSKDSLVARPQLLLVPLSALRGAKDASSQVSAGSFLSILECCTAHR